MMDFLLSNNDFEITNGDFAISATESQAIAQAITIRLKTIQREWFMDASLALPYFTEIFGHKRNERFIREIVVAEIKSIPGVREVIAFTAQEHSDRTLAIAFDVLLADGSAHTFTESVSL